MTYNQAIQNPGTVLIEFYASWCPHCQRMMPVVAQVKELLGDSVPVYQYDIDQNNEAANEARVQSIPTFIIYRDGEEMWRHSGEIDGNLLLAKVESFA
ncbi:MAG: thioredoxin family protein [Duncaniella sp.]|nr:thioredoxin family protein [Bacteroides sp.]MDE5827972.1 thioredoxin family protein [Duncaniella sp.]MBD5300923.1 thioredoxin family protein [Bacteroides sp.]MBD5319042.1 thioredoxin family protein [Bacteroides sp.]MDE6061528.1 thioredoxin family protein [Duncaniella sp.]